MTPKLGLRFLTLKEKHMVKAAHSVCDKPEHEQSSQYRETNLQCRLQHVGALREQRTDRQNEPNNSGTKEQRESPIKACEDTLCVCL